MASYWFSYRFGVALTGIGAILLSLGLTALLVMTKAAGGAQGGLPLLPMGVTFAVGMGLALWSLVPQEIE